MPPGHDEQSLAYLDREASALSQQGDEFGDNPALTDAIDRNRTLLKRRTRERVPLQWAMTQNNLGNALWRLGERTHDGGQLEEARKAISAAFDVFMQAGQQQHRSYFEARLHKIDQRISALKTAR